MLKPLFLFFALVSVVLSAPITYTFEQLGSGSLGGTPFTDAQVTLVLTGDTSTIVHPSATVYRNSGSATVTVAGLGTAEFNIPMRVFSNTNSSVLGAGISRVSDGRDLLAVLFVPGLSTYQLDTSIGPFTGTPGGNPSLAYSTTAGDFFLSTSNTPARLSTFTATLGSEVPEPASVGLVALGLGALLLRRRR